MMIITIQSKLIRPQWMHFNAKNPAFYGGILIIKDGDPECVFVQYHTLHHPHGHQLR